VLFEIYFLLFGISLIIVGLGYYSDVDILKITGFMFIFVLGTVLFGFGGGGITYHDGDIINTTGVISVITPSYSEYNNHTFGFFISVIGIIGFSSVYLQRKGGNIEQ